MTLDLLTGAGNRFCERAEGGDDARSRSLLLPYVCGAAAGVGQRAFHAMCLP